MLVHMSPGEVAGLQSLAETHGTSLTINPKTGLPEAFKLKSILPMIAGAVATFFTGGAAAPWMAALAGAGTGALTGDKNQSLLMRMGLGALGGWGGGGIGSALANAGKNAAGTALTSAGQAAAKEAGAGGISQVVPTAVKVGQTAAQTAQAAGVTSPAALEALKGAAGSLTQPAVGTSAAKLAGLGLKNIVSNPTLIGGQALKELGMTKAFAAVAPITAAAPPTLKGSKEVPPEYQMYSYNQGKQNPNFGKPGHEGEPPILGQSYSAPQITKQNPFAPTYAAYDKKGKPVGPAGLSPLELYMQGLQQQQSQQDSVPQINAAEGGSLDDYMDNVNASGMGGSMQPYKSPYVSTPGFTGNRFEGMGAFGGGMGLGMNAYSGSGYGVQNQRYNPTTGTYGYAAGGGIESVGDYSDGGRLLKGPGDGVSDDIPATIHRDDGSKQEARLADGEFVIDAQTVSKLGNGSTEAGARKLYAMMDRIHAIKTKPGKDLNADKYLPA